MAIPDIHARSRKIHKKDEINNTDKPNTIRPAVISPILTMCGQCCSVLTKNGFVTPRITDGLQQYHPSHRPQPTNELFLRGNSANMKAQLVT